MKYCPHCKVGVHKDNETCPLCGKFVDTRKEDFYPHYKENIHDKVSFPPSKNLLKAEKKYSLLLFWLPSAFAILFNVLYEPNFIFAHYISFGLLLLYLNVFNTVFKKQKFLTQLISNNIILSTFIILIDLFAVGGWQGYSLTFGLPIVFIAGIIFNDVFILFQKNKNKDHCLSLVAQGFFAMIPSVILWILPGRQFELLAFISLLMGVTNSVLIRILAWKYVKDEFSKKFFLK